LVNQIEKLPAYLELTAKSEKVTIRNILLNLLEIDYRKINNNAAWLKETTDAFTVELTRDYVNEILIDETLKFGKNRISLNKYWQSVKGI